MAVTADIPAESARSGSEAGPNQPRYTCTSRSVGCRRGSAKCSEPDELMARAVLPGRISKARPWRAGRSSTIRPPCQAKPDESIMPAELARVPPLAEPAPAPGLKYPICTLVAASPASRRASAPARLPGTQS